MNGARFAGVMFPYEETILIGCGVAVALAAADDGALDAGAVPPPHATVRIARTTPSTKRERIAATSRDPVL
jgi:hypothetical protein